MMYRNRAPAGSIRREITSIRGSHSFRDATGGGCAKTLFAGLVLTLQGLFLPPTAKIPPVHRKSVLYDRPEQYAGNEYRKDGGGKLVVRIGGDEKRPYAHSPDEYRGTDT